MSMPPPVPGHGVRSGAGGAMVYDVASTDAPACDRIVCPILDVRNAEQNEQSKAVRAFSVTTRQL